MFPLVHVAIWQKIVKLTDLYKSCTILYCTYKTVRLLARDTQECIDLLFELGAVYIEFAAHCNPLCANYMGAHTDLNKVNAILEHSILEYMHQPDQNCPCTVGTHVLCRNGRWQVVPLTVAAPIPTDRGHWTLSFRSGPWEPRARLLRRRRHGSYG